MEDTAPSKLSTSALAKMLEIPSSQLFATLLDYSWIKKVEDSWTLTSKGEFEGGEYFHSKRYGRYIVWPAQLSEHPLLQALEDNRHISATSLAKQAGLNAREVNRIFAELGWIKHSFQGWELTLRGEQQGGVQLENESSGTFYVVWPQALDQNAILNRELDFATALFSDAVAPDSTSTIEDDLFAEGQSRRNETVLSRDGHIHKTQSQAQICHWLYMAGIAHACERRLPIEEEQFADFYLPIQQIYVESWDEDSSSALAKKMQRKEFYQNSGLTVIDVEVQHLGQLDEFLTREFRKHGIRVY